MTFDLLNLYLSRKGLASVEQKTQANTTAMIVSSEKPLLKQKLDHIKDVVEKTIEKKMKGGSRAHCHKCSLFAGLNRHSGPTSGVRNLYFSGGRIFKNALSMFESAN